MYRWLRDMIKASKRVLKISKRPNKEQFEEIIRVTGMGILALGAIGAIVQFIFILVGFSGI